MAEGDIIAQMDTFALDLLSGAKSAEALADKTAAFKEVAKWVAIKNRLEDAGEEGEGIRDLKSRFKSDDAKPTRGPGAGRGAHLRDRSRDPDEPGAGTGLEALRARIPGSGRRGDDGGVHGDRGDSGGAAASAARRNRRVRPVIPGGEQPDAADNDSSG